MDIIVEYVPEKPRLALLKLSGDLDANSFRQVITAGRNLYAAGSRDLLLDLSGVSFMSSSGIVALHSLALIMRGEKSPDLEQGWNAMHAVADYVDESTGFERHFKLLSPTARVRHTLDTTGFDQTFEVFDEREAALSSFA
jgi:anti-anti-sigma regulatory factor